MDENVTRLRAAIEASQRRIDAVMAAIREQISDNAPYGANGRISARSPRMRDLIVGLHEDWLMTSTSSRATGSTRSPLRILHLCDIAAAIGRPICARGGHVEIQRQRNFARSCIKGDTN